jgi:hypothetical protein
MDIKKLCIAVKARKVEWKRHVLERMIECGINRSQVITVLEKGEVIENYADDYPLPSALMLGFVGGVPLHVVVALDSDAPTAYIITVYEPRADIFGRDYRVRNKK